MFLMPDGKEMRFQVPR